MRTIILHCPHLQRDISALAALPEAEILLGEPTPKGEDGCLEMHKAAVRMAMAEGDPAVFVLEDDCQFTRHWRYEQWLDDAAWAQGHGYQVLVGGCVQTYDPVVVRRNPLLIKVDVFHSAHCIIYFESAYEKILQTEQPFDMSVGRVGCRVVMTYPFVAVQRPSFSGILQRDVNYVPLYEQYEYHLGNQLGIHALLGR